jgi:hypothetical protein
MRLCSSTQKSTEAMKIPELEALMVGGRNCRECWRPAAILSRRPTGTGRSRTYSCSTPTIETDEVRVSGVKIQPDGKPDAKDYCIGI